MCKILSNQTAKTIDVLLSVVIFLGLLSNICGIIIIDWGVTTEIFHILFINSSVILLISFFCSLLIIYFRLQNTLFTIWALSMKYIIYLFGFLNFIGLVLVLTCLFYISNDLSTHILNQPGYDFKLEFFIKQQWQFILFSFLLTVFFYVLQFPLWNSTLKRLKLKTNGSLRIEEFVIINN